MSIIKLRMLTDRAAGYRIFLNLTNKIMKDA